jgi:hypothetical protein
MMFDGRCFLLLLTSLRYFLSVSLFLLGLFFMVWLFLSKTNYPKKIWIITFISKYLIINSFISLLIFLWLVYHGRQGLIYTLWNQFVKSLSFSSLLVWLNLFLFTILIQLHMPFFLKNYYILNNHQHKHYLYHLLMMNNNSLNQYSFWKSFI